MSKLLIGPFGVHYAKIVDDDGNYIKWASLDAVEHHICKEFDSLNRRGTSIDMSVPYNEKNEAKKLGAQWDPYKRVWYTNQDNPKLDDILVKYPHWISVQAIDYCERHANTPLVYTNEALEDFRAFQKKHGYRTDDRDCYLSEYEVEEAREKELAEKARKKQEMFEHGKDFFTY
jgi:hypothetical protein